MSLKSLKSSASSWSTPIIANVGGQDQLILGVPKLLKGFDPAAGKELWSCAGLGNLVYTSPLYADGIAVQMSGFHGPALAVKLGGKGDITKDRLWHHTQKIPQRIGTGVIIGGLRRGWVPEALMARAVGWMTLLNRDACALMLEAGARACTDVTGFGLLGHALGGRLDAAKRLDARDVHDARRLVRGELDEAFRREARQRLPQRHAREPEALSEPDDRELLARSQLAGEDGAAQDIGRDLGLRPVAGRAGDRGRRG